MRTVTVGRDALARMADAVSGAARMREFRRYVADTPGRRLVQLWIDIERFHRLADERSRWLLYREIQITFYEFRDAPTAGRHDQCDASCVLVGTFRLPDLLFLHRRAAQKLIHTAIPDTTKLSCLCGVRFGGVNWISDNSRLSPAESLQSDTFRPVVRFTPVHQTRHRQDRLVVSGVAV